MLEVTHEEIGICLDAFRSVHFIEPIYNDGEKILSLFMDQLVMKKKDEQWVEEISIEEGMKRLNDRRKWLLENVSSKERHRWSSQKNWGFHKRKYHVREVSH